ncbi:MAG: hypothetical protein JXA20_15475 [Spirochaetes bacterium]|nr:hypothetical protein [Spirochaetota bacterium]
METSIPAIEISEDANDFLFIIVEFLSVLFSSNNVFINLYDIIELYIVNKAGTSCALGGMNCASMYSFFAKGLQKGRAHREFGDVAVIEEHPMAPRQHVVYTAAMPYADAMAFVYPDDNKGYTDQ